MNWSSEHKQVYDEIDFTEVGGEKLLKSEFNFMQGYKTWVGLLLTLLGAFGWGDLVSDGQVTQTIDAVTQLAGIFLAVYGNYKAHREIKSLGGYR